MGIYSGNVGALVCLTAASVRSQPPLSSMSAPNSRDLGHAILHVRGELQHSARQSNSNGDTSAHWEKSATLAA